MVDIATGKRIRCKRPTMVLFPLAFGFDHHERDFLLAGEPGGGRIVYRPLQDRFELHLSFTYERPQIDTGDRFLGVECGIDTLAFLGGE
jgi:hypothetical protein